MPINALAKLDRIATETDLTSAPAERRRRVPKRIGELIELLLSGAVKTQKAACERTGMNQQYVSMALRRPEIRVFIAQRVREHLSLGTLRASAKLLELIDGPSARVAFEASRLVLAVDGVKPTETPNISINVGRAGFVIDLRTPLEVAAGIPLASAAPAIIDATTDEE